MAPAVNEPKKISWRYLFLLSIPVATLAFVEKCSGTALTFTLKKHIDSPAWILFLTSISSLFAIIIAPWAAYKSDNIQTWLGRRKTLIAAGFIPLAISLLFIPGVTSFAVLIFWIIIYQFSVDLGYTGPWKPLYFDIVPKSQRGRGMVINRYASIAARFIFMFFLIGQFDHQIDFKKASSALTANRWASFSGEQIIYFSAAVLVIISLAMILLFIKEPGTITAKKIPKISLPKYFKMLFTNRQYLLMSLLVVSSVLMSTKLMSLRPLLITEQFGYSKQVFGNMHSITMLINTTLILPLLAVFIDRIDKFKIYVVCIIFSTLHPLIFWLYVKFVAPNGIPSVPVIIGFNIADSTFDRTALLVIWPYLFDMVDPEKKGYMNSMFLIVAGSVKFINTNLMGLSLQTISSFSGNPEKINYMNCYIYIFILGLIACAGTFFYAKKSFWLSLPVSFDFRNCKNS